MNSLPEAESESVAAGSRTRDVIMAIPAPYQAATTPPSHRAVYVLPNFNIRAHRFVDLKRSWEEHCGVLTPC